MDNAWIIAFYKETDPVKRLELLKANTGDGESEKDKYRKQLWIARYGKRTPVKDEFMKTASTVQENAEDILAEAKQINEERAAKEAALEQEAEEVTEETVADNTDFAEEA